MLNSLQQTRVISEFDSQYAVRNQDESVEHHEEGHATQQTFHRQSMKVIEFISDCGNPIADSCDELLVLNTRSCADESVMKTVKTLKHLVFHYTSSLSKMFS